MNICSTKADCLALLILILSLFSYGCNDEIVYPEGGYPYFKNISSRDSNNYFLPIRHLIPDRDSFLAFDSKYFFQGFDEDNLSLSPPKEDIFRFTFECGFCGKAAIVRLTKSEIVIKKTRLGYSGLNIDKDLLSPVEKEHFYLFERYYPFDNPRHSMLYRKYFDSVLKTYPQLADLSYFDRLRKRASVIHKMPEKYVQESIPIRVDKFNYLVNLLNSSGFWQRSYRNDCEIAPTDGDGFGVEAATKNKYHFINSDYCQKDYENSGLRKMINELLSFIKFDLNAFYEESNPIRKP